MSDEISPMEKAIVLAESAADHGEVPVGAVVTHANDIIAEGRNQREARQDPTAHAELIAMRKAAERRGSWRLTDCTVYVTLEPCPMCCGTMINARLPELVFGASDPNSGCVESLYHLLDDERFNHTVNVAQSPLAERCGQLLKDFFRDVRNGEAPPKPSE